MSSQASLTQIGSFTFQHGGLKNLDYIDTYKSSVDQSEAHIYKGLSNINICDRDGGTVDLYLDAWEYHENPLWQSSLNVTFQTKVKEFYFLGPSLINIVDKINSVKTNNWKSFPAQEIFSSEGAQKKFYNDLYPSSNSKIAGRIELDLRDRIIKVVNKYLSGTDYGVYYDMGQIRFCYQNKLPTYQTLRELDVKNNGRLFPIFNKAIMYAGSELLTLYNQDRAEKTFEEIWEPAEAKVAETVQTRSSASVKMQTPSSNQAPLIYYGVDFGIPVSAAFIPESQARANLFSNKPQLHPIPQSNPLAINQRIHELHKIEESKGQSTQKYAPRKSIKNQQTSQLNFSAEQSFQARKRPAPFETNFSSDLKKIPIKRSISDDIQLLTISPSNSKTSAKGKSQEFIETKNNKSFNTSSNLSHSNSPAGASKKTQLESLIKANEHMKKEIQKRIDKEKEIREVRKLEHNIAIQKSQISGKKLSSLTLDPKDSSTNPGITSPKFSHHFTSSSEFLHQQSKFTSGIRGYRNSPK